LFSFIKYFINTWLVYDYERQVVLLRLGIDKESNSPVELSPDDRRQGTYVAGVNGTGKTVLLMNTALSDAEAGDGLCFLDPHGDAVEALLALMPEHRKKDVIYFNPADIDYPFGLNLFECPDISDPRMVDLVCSEIIGTFKKLYEASWGPRLEDILRHAILVVLYNPGSTLLDLHLVLSSKDYRLKMLENVKDPIITQYWEKIFPKNSKDAQEWLASSFNKIGRFLVNSLIRNIVSQPESSFNVRDVMNQGKILLVNLAKGKIGEDNSSLLGSVLVGKILIAALSRAEVRQEKRKQFHLICDEYQSFATESFPTLQSEARKFAIDTLVAHQYRDQLDFLNKGSTLNVGNFIFFRITGKDSLELAVQFDNTPPVPELEPQPMLYPTGQNGVYRTGDRREYVMAKGKPRTYSDVAQEMANRLSNLPNHECWCKLIKNGRLVEHQIATEPITKPENPKTAEEIIENSRKLAGNREKVESEIRAKMSSADIFIKPKAFEKIETKKIKKG
jgi:hypothetical protein